MARYARRKSQSRSRSGYRGRSRSIGFRTRSRSGSGRRAPRRTSSGTRTVRIELVQTAAQPVSRPDVMQVQTGNTARARF